jgi:hypothetical protein
MSTVPESRMGCNVADQLPANVNRTTVAELFQVFETRLEHLSRLLNVGLICPPYNASVRERIATNFSLRLKHQLDTFPPWNWDGPWLDQIGDTA